jgi:hypothetical protein
VIIAYADPPYLGCSSMHYGDHPESANYDNIRFHADLIRHLIDDYPDGWALSCNPKDLREYLPLMPKDVRIAAWCKTWHRIRPNVTVQYAWEPLIYRGGRNLSGRKPMVRDWMSCAATRLRGTIGAKPEPFCYWLFNLLGMGPDDELVDMFPGSGAVMSAWRTFKSGGVLIR